MSAITGNDPTHADAPPHDHAFWKGSKCPVCTQVLNNAADMARYDAALLSLLPDPGNVSSPPAWEDVERLALHYPAVQQAVTLVRRGALTREQALIASLYGMARVVSAMHAQGVARLSSEKMSDTDLRRLGPPRWKCKQCGKERRRGECLHCGNTQPITDEPAVPGAVR